jgi:hypothetical protein
MALIQEKTTAVAAPPEPQSRGAIEAEITAVSARRAEFLRDVLLAVEAAEKAEGDALRAALVSAVRANRPAPSRESLNKAEAAVRQSKEQLVAFDVALADLGAERLTAINRERQAEREANTAEMERLAAALPGLQAAAHAAQLAVSENASRHQSLLYRNQPLAAPYRPK